VLSSPAFEERAHELVIDAPESGIVVHADPARLAQVIANLLTNAAKYTPHAGRISLRVQSSTSKVEITVKDNGIGIEPSLLPHVFDLFVQGRQGIDRAVGGLGLGLAIAKSLLEMHGGSIRVHSDGANTGSEFTLELPRFANTRPSKPNLSGAFALPAARARRVLVVDDNEDAAFLFSEALKRMGHHVDVAYDGPSALECARKQLPEVAFLDIGLPVMDGYELGRRLRELGGPNPPHLIAVTGYGHTSDRERSREAGFDLHLVKPVELAAVQAALEKLE
jgi:CheY-like chemotaxis protein